VRPAGATGPPAPSWSPRSRSRWAAPHVPPERVPPESWQGNGWRPVLFWLGGRTIVSRPGGRTAQRWSLEPASYQVTARPVCPSRRWRTTGRQIESKARSQRQRGSDPGPRPPEASSQRRKSTGDRCKETSGGAALGSRAGRGRADPRPRRQRGQGVAPPFGLSRTEPE
jgi:hypothetical protein